MHTEGKILISGLWPAQVCFDTSSRQQQFLSLGGVMITPADKNSSCEHTDVKAESKRTRAVLWGRCCTDSVEHLEQLLTSLVLCPAGSLLKLHTRSFLSLSSKSK